MAKIVCIDPGHGGTDSGAINSKLNVLEKDMNLAMGLLLEAAFIRQGVGVVMTRRSDTYLTREGRTIGVEGKIENCAAFITVHMDSSVVNPEACGASIFLHSKAPNSYVAWGNNVMKGIESVGITSNRATKVARGYVNNHNADYFQNAMTKSPSMLIELGFITHTANINEHKTKREQYAEEICKHTCNFIGVQYVEPVVVQPDPKPAVGLYRVQAGAYSSRTNAIALLDQLKKDGYKAVIVEPQPDSAADHSNLINEIQALNKQVGDMTDQIKNLKAQLAQRDNECMTYANTISKAIGILNMKD